MSTPNSAPFDEVRCLRQIAQFSDALEWAHRRIAELEVDLGTLEVATGYKRRVDWVPDSEDIVNAEAFEASRAEQARHDAQMRRLA